MVSELDRATEKNNSSLWLVPAAGGEPKQLTTAPGANNHPRWSPDGKSIAFVSHRGGSDQVWLLPIDGGEPHQLTKLPIDVSGPIWSPKGDKIAFAAEVYPGLTPEQTAAKDKEKEASKKKVRIYDRLMIRHWKAWDEGKRSHLFVVDAQTGEAKDLTPKLEVNTPPAPFGGSIRLCVVARRQGTRLHCRARPGCRLVDQHRHLDRAGRRRRAQKHDRGQSGCRRPAGLFARRQLAGLCQPVAGGFRVGLVGTEDPMPVRPGRAIELTKALDRPVQSFVGSQAAKRWPRSSTTCGTEPIIAIEPGAVGTVRSGTAVAPEQFPRLVTGGVQAGLNVSPKTGKMVFAPSHSPAAGRESLLLGPMDGPHPAHTPQRPPDLPTRSAQARRLHISGSRRRRSSRLAAPSAGVRPEPRNTRSSS